MPSLEYAIARSDWMGEMHRMSMVEFMEEVAPRLDAFREAYAEHTGSEDGFDGLLADVIGDRGLNRRAGNAQQLFDKYEGAAKTLAQYARLVPDRQDRVPCDYFEIPAAGRDMTQLGGPRLMPFGHDALTPSSPFGAAPFFRYSEGTERTFVRLGDYDVAVFKNGRYENTASRSLAFSNAVGKLPNADAFLGTLDLWRQDLLWRTGLALHFIRAGDNDMDAAIPALRGVYEFFKAGMPAFKKNLDTVTGDNRLMQTFARMHMAAVNNLIAPLCVFIGDLNEATADKSFFMEVVTGLESLFDPFAHIRSTYMPADGAEGIDTKVEGKVPEWKWDGNIGNAWQMQSFIGAIAFMAALNRAKVRVSWEEGGIKGLRFEIEWATPNDLQLMKYRHLVEEASPHIDIELSIGTKWSTIRMGPFNQGGPPSVPILHILNAETIRTINPQKHDLIFMADRFRLEGNLERAAPSAADANYFGVMTNLGLTDVTMAPLGTAAYALGMTGVMPFYARVM